MVDFVLCECKKFAHVVSAEVLRRLPQGYHGERCQECNLWMCSVEKLREAGYTIAHPEDAV